MAGGVVHQQRHTDHDRRHGVHAHVVPRAGAQIRVGVQADGERQQGEFGGGNLLAAVQDSPLGDLVGADHDDDEADADHAFEQVAEPVQRVAEWGILDSRKQVAAAELALLALTVGLNTYPYLRSGSWYDVGVHAVAPVMIGVALLVHDAASHRYGQAIVRATEQIQDLPDPAEQIRRTLPTFVSFIRQSAPDTRPGPAPLPALPKAPAPEQPEEAEAAKPEVSDAETVEPTIEPDIWTPKSTATTTKSWRADGKDSAPANGKKDKPKDPEPDPTTDPSLYDTGQFRIAETLEQELAELRAERRRARAEKKRTASSVNGNGLDD
ncbi:hypothetical protein [Nocardia terpenica]|uniref:hypothetical protein n=1 Tax=Nocardia terpenica TaxID=455432 RepID=UPI0018D59CAC|nr:hypothetical protein [Nocardia terpenica]